MHRRLCSCSTGEALRLPVQKTLSEHNSGNCTDADRLHRCPLTGLTSATLFDHEFKLLRSGQRCTGALNFHSPVHSVLFGLGARVLCFTSLTPGAHVSVSFTHCSFSSRHRPIHPTAAVHGCVFKFRYRTSKVSIAYF